mmetsp:Transcript_10260/g.20927  ORF Transcript_10260/g.20927 Transcript_10260/m.20927 type:complete len:253 (-) Transcript_10260:55-813(-)
MVDEWEAAAEAPAPVRAAGEADDVAEAPEAEVEIISGADKSLRGRAASQSPSAGSDVPRLADGPRAAPSAGLGVGGAPGDDPKAGSHRSDVCPPLWKVSLRAARLPPTPSLDIWMISCLLLMWPRSESAAVPGWVLLRVQLAHDCLVCPHALAGAPAAPGRGCRMALQGGAWRRWASRRRPGPREDTSGDHGAGGADPGRTLQACPHRHARQLAGQLGRGAQLDAHTHWPAPSIAPAGHACIPLARRARPWL